MWTQAEQEALDRLTEAEAAVERARNELHAIMRREAIRERALSISRSDAEPGQPPSSPEGSQ